jgi:hypothetical protein
MRDANLGTPGANSRDQLIALARRIAESVGYRPQTVPGRTDNAGNHMRVIDEERVLRYRDGLHTNVEQFRQELLHEGSVLAVGSHAQNHGLSGPGAPFMQSSGGMLEWMIEHGPDAVRGLVQH